MKLKLTAEKINDKIFEGSDSGYDANQVDAFLDLVISDYNQIQNLVQHYEHSITVLEAENKKLILQNHKLSSQLDIEKTVVKKAQDKITETSNMMDRLNEVENTLLVNKQKNNK